MAILATFSPDHEIYSIDECFLGFDGIRDRSEVGQDIRHRVRHWTGLPVCVGIGASKTLAKLANHIAKKRPEWNGVCDLTSVSDPTPIIGDIEVGEVWGVGRKTVTRLDHLGVRTVRQLMTSHPKAIRQAFSVVMERTVMELRGVPCQLMEDVTPPKQQIVSSRSFGRPIHDLQELEEAIATYVGRAAEKLRRQESAAGIVHVFVQTDQFRPELPQHHQGIAVPLVVPSSDTRALTQAALRGLKHLFRPGFAYKKAGAMLMELQPADRISADLFEPVDQRRRSEALMRVLDAANRKFGRGALRVGAEGVTQPWAMKMKQMSPSYTTRWTDLMRVASG